MSEILKSERGINTVEIVIIMAVLVTVALIFRASVFGFVKKSINGIFKDEQIIHMERNILPGLDENI
ncbi:MAG: hypothetical protein N4A47_05430 [Clostridia bacterium]|jgi:Flp pilus assembly pilin Flp|nr:hypothetical protein [Clostridia bacterium]